MRGIRGFFVIVRSGRMLRCRIGKLAVPQPDRGHLIGLEPPTA